MPRIAGIDVPDKKKIFFALQYIHGIGTKFAGEILAECKAWLREQLQAAKER